MTVDSYFSLREHDDVGMTVVEPLADLRDDVADMLRPALMSAAAAGRHVVVDMRAVHTIEPGGLSLLVRAHREARQHGGMLSLAAPSRFVLTVLHTMHLDGVFPILEDTLTGRPHPAG
ncbi:STAS domain-containing protein [Actinoplanes sp. GCM10030250]|uniref:STAS domain-containing protein n=1 Tax=Actinoplanes sp. GCM10030250 TaxID=3273376 RepID=UPI003607B58A